MCIASIRVTDPGGVESAARSALRIPGPILLGVLTRPDEIAVPPKPTVEQDRGFVVAEMQGVRGHREENGN
ncbi:hypothetical protein K1Y78_39570 [Streptomyces sp. tea 10]|nr:hypothetical protein [Streptomyces sp. tea 10]